MNDDQSRIAGHICETLYEVMVSDYAPAYVRAFMEQGVSVELDVDDPKVEWYTVQTADKRASWEYRYERDPESQIRQPFVCKKFTCQNSVDRDIYSWLSNGFRNFRLNRHPDPAPVWPANE